MAKAPKTVRKARVSTVPANESKAQRFSRLASARVTKAVKTITQIGNLSSSGYEYTAEQRDKIEQMLFDTVKGTMVRFPKAGSGTSSAPAAKIEI